MFSTSSVVYQSSSRVEKFNGVDRFERLRNQKQKCRRHLPEEFLRFLTNLRFFSQILYGKKKCWEPGLGTWAGILLRRRVARRFCYLPPWVSLGRSRLPRGWEQEAEAGQPKLAFQLQGRQTYCSNGRSCRRKRLQNWLGIMKEEAGFL